MPSQNCYDSIFCYADPECPLFETCERIKAEEESREIIEKFLGDLDNWKPTGLQPPGLSSPEET
jgi:hypothetical protein